MSNNATILEVLTMDEVEQLVLLTGKSFEEQFANGIALGKPAKVLCWILEKRTNPESQFEDFGKFTIHQVHAFVKGFLTDPKAPTT